MKNIFFAFFLFASNIFAETLPQSNFYLKREGYSLDYDGRTRQPVWVVEHLSKGSISGNVKRDTFKFTEDKDLPIPLRSTLSDYKGSGYDRGHMAPAADHKKSERAMSDTFLLSNMSPQTPAFNRGYWASLEKYVRELVQRYDKVTVVTGPLFLPYKADNGKKYVCYEVIGGSNVAVPTHYFKVIRAKGIEEAYILPNCPIDSKTPMKNFQTTVQKLEKVAGIVFR